jgi:transposase-like protein
MAQANRSTAMEPTGSRRRRRSREEGFALVREWQASGLRAAEFCRGRGVAEHRLQYWKRQSQSGGTATGNEASAFYAMMAPASGAFEATAPEAVAEICVKGALRVRVSLAAGREAFVQALRGVLEVVES